MNIRDTTVLLLGGSGLVGLAVARALLPHDPRTIVLTARTRDEVEPAAKELEEEAKPVMLVGHLPFMERLAGRMLTGDADQAVIDFTNAGIVCLERKDKRWQAAWILTPELAGRND